MIDSSMRMNIFQSILFVRFSRVLATPVFITLFNTVLFAKVASLTTCRKKFGLDGTRMDTMLVKDLSNGSYNIGPVGSFLDLDVCGTEDHAINQLPDVKIVNRDDAIEHEDLLANVCNVHLLGSSLKKNPDTAKHDR